MFVLDSHCDTPSQIHRLRDLNLDNEMAHVDFPKLFRGKVDGAFFALYVPTKYTGEDSTRFALELLDGVNKSLDSNVDKAILVRSPEEARKCQSDGKFAVFLALENGSALNSSFTELENFYNKGVRYITLCHSEHNDICDSCAPSEGKWMGLSPFGKDLIERMNKIGMIIDVSHISDDSFFDVIKYSKSPIVASHSCCRALANHKRNMTDEMIIALAKNGGVIQINFYPFFLDDDFKISSELDLLCDKIEGEFIANPADKTKQNAWLNIQKKLHDLARPSYTKIVDHVDHVVNLVGVDYVGLGSDFDGISITPQGLDDISEFGKVLEEMRKRGYLEEDIEKIAGGNFFRVFSNVTSNCAKI